MSVSKNDDRIIARINRKKNDKKYFCHFTGFLEGVMATGRIELEELAPLVEECIEFVTKINDPDASDVIEDFKADLLECEGLNQIIEVRVTGIDKSCDISSLNRFLGFCRGIVCDGRVYEAEAAMLLHKLEAHEGLLLHNGVREIRNLCVDALADGIVSIEESVEICEAISEIVGDSYHDTGVSGLSGVANFHETIIHGGVGSLSGATIVLTGKFKVEPRSILENRVHELGVQITKTVSGRVDYLIVGGAASRDWLEANRGTKIKKALELRTKGVRPGFVSEHQLMKLMNSDA